MQRDIRYPIRHQDMDLSAKKFNGINPVNTLKKLSALGVWQRPEIL